MAVRDVLRKTLPDKAASFGLNAAVATMNGQEDAAWVWAFGAAHFGRKALEAGCYRDELGRWLEPGRRRLTCPRCGSLTQWDCLCTCEGMEAPAWLRGAYR